MTVLRGFTIIGVSACASGIIGALIGLLLGTFAPGYYRTVFRYGDSPDFSAVQVGAGLGLSQGLIAGLIIGCVVVLAVTWYRIRRPVEPSTRQILLDGDD
jgi:hypothetical protein